jgi:hypothetical protein
MTLSMDTLPRHSLFIFFCWILCWICLWPDQVYTEASAPQLCILGDWDVLGDEALRMVMEACQLYNYDI